MAKFGISPQGADELLKLSEKLKLIVLDNEKAGTTLFKEISSYSDKLGVYDIEIKKLAYESIESALKSSEDIFYLSKKLQDLSSEILSMLSISDEGFNNSSQSSNMNANKTQIGSSSKSSNTGKITYNEFGVQSIESVSNWIKEINPNPGNDPRRAVNCGNCAAAVFKRLNGDCSAVAGIGTYSISEMNKLTGKRQTTMTPEQIKDFLVSQGPGSHAVVGVDRASGAGHWFNAYYDGNQVFTIEGQSGEVRGWPPDYGEVVHWDISI